MGQKDIPRQIPIVNNKRKEATTASSYRKIYVQKPTSEALYHKRVIGLLICNYALSMLDCWTLICLIRYTSVANVATVFGFQVHMLCSLLSVHAILLG